MIELPNPYRARPATVDDIEAIWRLMVIVNLAEAGTPGFGLSEIENWLTGDPIVIGQDVLVVVDGSDAVFGVEILDSRGPFVRPHAIGGVHPDHLGKGVGGAMLEWARQRAVAQLPKAPAGANVKFLTFTAADHGYSNAMMEAFGLDLVRYFIDMEVEFSGPPPAPQLPNGVSIRTFDPEGELQELAQLSQDGFRDHYGFVEDSVEQRVKSLEHWMTSADHDPALWWVAAEGGRLVGFNLCEPSSEGDADVGYVASLAVLPSHRGRGLGRAMLLTAFEKFFGQGKKGASLGVDADSLTGATRLYESVGMAPGARYALWEMMLRPGEELATLEVAD